MRFPVEVVRRIRAAVSDDFIVIFRIAAMDMLQGGMSWEELVQLGKAVERAGANIVSTHFTWHEAAVPTISTRVPRAAFAGVTGRLRKELGIPTITSNRINMPDVAEQVLVDGHADLDSMARPMLADAEFVQKAREGREDEINTCIACNQACLDHTFTGQEVSCLVNPRVDAQQLKTGTFDHIVIATGIQPRVPELEGIDHPKVVSYIDVIKGNKPVGEKVAIMGAGGIGFDVAELILHHGTSAALDLDVFAREWGIDFQHHPRGGVTGVEPVVEKADRDVYLLQRKATPVGRGLGKTTGWTHRMSLARREVNMINAVEYQKIDDKGLHISIADKPQLLDVGTIIVCAGQMPLRELYDEPQDCGLNVSLVGGAYEAAELNAKSAIKQASYLAAAV